MITLLHFSDIHVFSKSNLEFFNKRFVGILNFKLRREKYYRDVYEKIEALKRFINKRKVDVIINTGDYTTSGHEQELKIARRLIEPLIIDPKHYLTIAGNHDIYVNSQRSYKNFFREFNILLHSDMPRYSYNDIYPIVRLVGDNCAIIMINSARANRLPWKSSGKVPLKELKALEDILRDEEMKGRFIFVGTHYAPSLKNGDMDTQQHGLTNANELLNVCKEIDNGAIICGHVHDGYHTLVDGRVKNGIFCAGSLTMKGHEGFWFYELEENHLKAFRGYFHNGEFLLDKESYILQKLF